MGLDQKLIRVANKDLEKFYATSDTIIIAPLNPNIDYDFVKKVNDLYNQLEEHRSQALLDNDPLQAQECQRQQYELVPPFDAVDIWYGRKENHIHQWVIDTCEVTNIEGTNLQYIEINPDKLLGDLTTVIKHPSTADDILPTRSGFFFGDTEYDEYYFDSLTSLQEILLLDKNSGYFDNCSYFYWSWW